MTSTAMPTEPANPASARAVFIAWEQLRVVFNLALIALVVILGREFWRVPGFLRYITKAGVVANVCYCSGPVLEGYLALAGVPRRAVRVSLFGGGLLVACWLSAIVVIAWPLHEQD